MKRLRLIKRSAYVIYEWPQRVSEFQTILGSFIDFLQKDKFAKLKKLRQNQANLPIAEYRQEILESLEKNQVIIIAGDTGKSFLEALILASTNPQYDKILFIQLQDQYMKIASSEHVKNMLCA